MNDPLPREKGGVNEFANNIDTFQTAQTDKGQNGFLFVAEFHSSVGSVQDFRTGGRWFDPRLGQYSFRVLIIVIATGFIPLSALSIVSTIVMWESSQWLGKNIVWSTGKELQESMDRYTDRRDITEILLKTALNIIQSVDLFLLVNAMRLEGTSLSVSGQTEFVCDDLCGMLHHRNALSPIVLEHSSVVYFFE